MLAWTNALAEYDELKNELNRTREDCINLQGIKQGLQSRLSEQEQVMMKLKAELLKLGFSHQTTNSDKDELQKILEERDREIALLRSQLVSKDDQLDEQRKELDTALTRIADVDTVEVVCRISLKNLGCFLWTTIILNISRYWHKSIIRTIYTLL